MLQRAWLGLGWGRRVWNSHFLATGGRNAACKPDSPGGAPRSALVSHEGSDPQNKLSGGEEQRRASGQSRVGGRAGGRSVLPTIQPCDCQAVCLCTPAPGNCLLLLSRLRLGPGLGVQRCPVRNDASPLFCAESCRLGQRA